VSLWQYSEMQRYASTAAVLLIAVAQAWGQGLRAGYAKTDITPDEPVRMAGYDMRDAPSDGIWGHDRLYARALVFEASGQKIAFVEADVIIIRGADEFRRKIAAATGIPFDHVLLGDAHNHAAPSPDAKLETNWDRQFEKGVMDAATRAAASLQPVGLAAGTGHSRVAMNRRHVIPADGESTRTFDENDRSQSFGKYKTGNPVQIREFGGVMRLGSNPGGPIDDEVQVVRIDHSNGKPLAVMIHYACHGTSLGGRNSKISGEWMGRMQEYVEKQFPGAGAIYLQGAAGDINPRVVGGLDGYQDNIETTWALGEEIGREVARVYRSLSPEPVPSPRVQVETADIQLPRAYRELFDDFAHTSISAPTTVVRIGDLMWTTFPGEMFSQIGKNVKAASPATHAFLMGYANGYIGYFPERRSYSEGGYEVATTHLDPAAEAVYMRNIAELMKRFQ
jgi:neutral ceramidase